MVITEPAMWIKDQKEGGTVDETFDMFHEILVRLFRDIMDIEGKAIITEEFKDISNNDMHIVEAIGIKEPKNMSTVARAMSVTVGTLTIAINSLVKKGYVNRSRSEVDRRVVYISLTEKGKLAFQHHEEFHQAMIAATISGLSEGETEVLVKALSNLNKFFREYDTD